MHGLLPKCCVVQSLSHQKQNNAHAVRPQRLGSRYRSVAVFWGEKKTRVITGIGCSTRYGGASLDPFIDDFTMDNAFYR